MKNALLCLILAASAVNAEDVFTNEFESLITTRQNSLVLKDPHLFQESIGCTDYTSFLNDFWFPSPFNNDFDNDSYLDLNILLQFKTDQPDYLVTKKLSLDVIDGQCPDPLFSGSCLIDSVTETNIETTSSETGVCLEPISGTTSMYSDPVVSTQAPCFVTEPKDISLPFLGVELPLQAFQQASRYQGGLALDQKLQMGFVSEAAALSVVIPDEVSFLGGSTLYDLLPGGGSCSEDDDRDIGPDGVTSGWWFFFNGESDLVELD